MTKPSAKAVKPVSLDVRRKAMADALFGDLERLRGQMFTPCVEHKAVVVSDGAHAGSHVEVVDIDLDEPTFGAKRLIVAAIAEGIDKVIQLAGKDADDYDDWTAPAGTTSIRDASKRKSGDVRSAGRARGAKARPRADAAPAAHLGRSS